MKNNRPTRRDWGQLQRFQREQQIATQQYRAPNQGIYSVEEIEYVLTNNKLEERINFSTRRLNKREYFNKLKKEAHVDSKKKADKVGRKERAAQNSAVTKLFGSGELIDVQLPDEDCNISGW